MQDFLPLVVAHESGHDSLVGTLLTAQLVELGSEGFFGLAHGGFVDALDVLLGLTSGAWNLAIALEGKADDQLAEAAAAVWVDCGACWCRYDTYLCALLATLGTCIGSDHTKTSASL